MDPDDVYDQLLEVREEMEEEKNEQEQIREQLRAREAELRVLMDGKDMEVTAQKDAIQQKRKEYDDQNDLLKELLKTRDNLEAELAGLLAENNQKGTAVQNEMSTTLTQNKLEDDEPEDESDNSV